MRTIIAGSRQCVNYSDLLMAIDCINWEPSVVLSGTARGADRLGEIWATEHNIPIEKFPANWNKYGKSAGYRRNAEMAKNANALLALWDFRSKGTKHMIELATRTKLVIYVHKITVKNGHCICTQLTALEPVVNPDCPIHGLLRR